MHRWVTRIVPAVAMGGSMVLTSLACTPAAQAPATASPTAVESGLLPSASATVAPTPSSTPVESTAPKVTPIAGAPDSGVVLHVVAKLARWDVTALTAPAGKTWKVEIDNQDATPHNFIVASGPDVGSRIYSIPKFPGPETRTFEIPGLPAGSYLFICSLHANTMTGSLTLE